MDSISAEALRGQCGKFLSTEDGDIFNLKVAKGARCLTLANIGDIVDAGIPVPWTVLYLYC